MPDSQLVLGLLNELVD